MTHQFTPCEQIRDESRFTAANEERARKIALQREEIEAMMAEAGL